jgi:hypothetical protein
MTVPRLPIRPSGVERPSWIERVREADAEAEAAWQEIKQFIPGTEFENAQKLRTGLGLIAIAAELRAQRIARRPGAGS